MSGYVKIYGSILDSSVWAEPPATRCVWLAMLAMADKDGRVEASPGGLERRANVTEKQLQTALDTLLAPDLDSKSPEHDGRRIEPCERGWLILNYQKYRELQTAKQVADAERAQAYRDRRTAEQGERDASRASQQVATTADGTTEAAVAGKELLNQSVPREGGTMAEQLLAARLPTDSDRNALTAICVVVPAPASWVADMAGALDGMHGFILTPVQLGEALRDYVANGSLTSPSFRHFRRYLQRAATTPHPSPAEAGDGFTKWAKDRDAKERPT